MATTKTVAELARWLGGEPEGDLAKPLTGAAALESAGATEISFLDSERNAPQARASQAGCLLAPAGVPLPDRTVIRVPNPPFRNGARSWVVPSGRTDKTGNPPYSSDQRRCRDER